MRIQSVNNNLSFGKTAVMKCVIKDSETKSKNSATLYKMDTTNPQDMKEVRYSKNARCIYYDFMIDAGKRQTARDYYLLKNDKTQEVIACAQTSRHVRPANASYDGQTTLIEEMFENPKYINGAEPVLAYIAHSAGSHFDKTVTTAFDQDEIPALRRAKFTQLKTGDWVLPEKRYEILKDQAEKHSDICYVG